MILRIEDLEGLINMLNSNLIKKDVSNLVNIEFEYFEGIIYMNVRQFSRIIEKRDCFIYIFEPTDEELEKASN